MNLLSVNPFTRIVGDWPVQDQRILTQIQKLPESHSFINFYDNDQPNNSKDMVKSNNPLLHQSTFLHVVTCTVFNYPHVFISEKNFKPITNMRPFILVSSPGSLDNMRQLGFKTFSDFWSEEYDTIVDHTKRLTTIVNLIETICNKTTDDLKRMCVDMQDILEYNYNYYYNDFINNEQIKFKQQCEQNLGMR